MPGNTLFYAYVHNVIDDNTWRLVIVFANRYVADEWWRSVSSLTNVAANAFRRVTPQFYTHDTSKANLVEFFYSATYKDIAPQFRGKLFITLDNDRGGRGISIIPEQDVIDYLNGNLFYIRSKDHRSLFWKYDHSLAPGCYLTASTTEHARFRVIAADRNLAEGTVLIGSDRVILKIANNLYVGVSDETGDLFSSNQPHEFLFSDLLGGRFSAVDGSTVRVVQADQSGEAWELAS